MPSFTKADALAFHALHPEMWVLFVQRAFELIHAGNAHGGARAIWERWRWETKVNKDFRHYGELFQCNNNLTRWYGRWFNAAYASQGYGEFFETREHGGSPDEEDVLAKCSYFANSR